MVNEKVLGATSLCLVLLMVIGVWLISSLANPPVLRKNLISQFVVLMSVLGF